MEGRKKYGMRNIVLMLLLALLQRFRLVDSFPNPSPLVGSNWGNPRRYVHLQTSTDLNNFYLEISLNGHVRKTTVRSSYSVILMKAETRERVAILGVKSNRYLCMDTAGNPFSSNTVPLERLLHREKRNRVVDPSDPHNVYGKTEEGSDSKAMPEEDADQEVEFPEGAVNVSRETPLSPSTHDPWNVHSTNSNVSPRITGTMG
ncbi:fibroblast growth factor 23 isoform X2 [Hypomesus transpacificus]|uniref:fibroblast growth factor 23 isoform X2 n=1 Tax=Hypomesus transpacificus TaxID=137520 RepID=UPI001F07DF50|nr:fibroblast growth factor 23 isoform X2 [Hypomesus transpacificus]